MAGEISFRQALEAGHTTVLSAQGTANRKGSCRLEEQGRGTEREDHGLSAEDSVCSQRSYLQLLQPLGASKGLWFAHGTSVLSAGSAFLPATPGSPSFCLMPDPLPFWPPPSLPLTFTSLDFKPEHENFQEVEQRCH